MAASSIINVPAWRSQLRSASFRGVPFGVFDTSNAGGRRTVSHEYPFRDSPYVEDLGRKARTYQLQAFVVGENYMSGRDALIQALETSGPGKLIHPFLGTLTVQAGEFSFTETRDDGGMASFSLTFLQTTDVVYPSAVSSAAAATQASATTVNTAASAALQSAWALTGQDPTAIKSAATQTVTDTIGIVSTGLAPAISRQTSSADAFAQAITNAKNQAAALIVSPVLLAAQYATLLAMIASAPDQLAAVASLVRLYGKVDAYFTSKSYGKSASQATAVANDAALRQTLLYGILAAAAGLAVNATYESTQQAQATVSSLDALFDALIYSVTDDGLYQSAVDLQVAVDAAIPPPGQTLPNVVVVPVTASIPSLVLAYDIYFDVSEELDIVARNDIVNPFCVPGNTRVSTLQGG